MLWLAKMVFMARKRSFLVHFQKTRSKVPIAKWSSRLYSVHVFYFSLWNGGRSPYLLGKPISESWVVSDVGDWVLWLFCSLKDLQNAVYKQMGLEMISLPSPTLLNWEVGLCWICKTVSEIQDWSPVLLLCSDCQLCALHCLDNFHPNRIQRNPCSLKLLLLLLLSECLSPIYIDFRDLWSQLPESPAPEG